MRNRFCHTIALQQNNVECSLTYSNAILDIHNPKAHNLHTRLQCVLLNLFALDMYKICFRSTLARYIITPAQFQHQPGMSNQSESSMNHTRLSRLTKR